MDISHVNTTVVSSVAELGFVLRRARLKKGLTQKQFAEIAVLSQARISDFERGECDVRVETLIKMLDAMGYCLAVVENLPDGTLDEGEDNW